MQKPVNFSEAKERKYPEQIALAVSVDKNGQADIITLGWCMQTSINPLMWAISIGHSRYSHQLVKEQKEFVLAFPGENLEKEMLYCGTYSGQEVDKFKETGLTPIPSKIVKPPLIGECLANFECEVIGELETGDHTIFAGKVVAAYVSETEGKRLYTFKGRKFKGL